MDIIIQFAIFLGIFLRLIFPYLRKRDFNPLIDFDWKFVHRSLITAVWEFIMGIVVFTSWEVPADIISISFTYILAFSLGWGGLDFQNEVEKWLRIYLPKFKDKY